MLYTWVWIFFTFVGYCVCASNKCFFYFPSYFFFSIKYIFYNSMALIAFIYMLFQELRTKMIKEKVNVVETAKDSSIVSLSVFLIYSRNFNQNRPLVAEITSLKFHLL